MRIEKAQVQLDTLQVNNPLPDNLSCFGRYLPNVGAVVVQAKAASANFAVSQQHNLSEA